MDDTGASVYQAPSSNELRLARSHFSVELVRFTDARRPRSMELQPSDRMIYQYDPDTLLQGTAYKSAALLSKYLCYRPTYPRDYKVEVDLEQLNTVIKTGTWWSGSWGRYSVKMELHVLARRPDSSVVLDKLYTFTQERARKDFNGRGPSKERDRSMMYDMVESGLRQVAEEIGMDLRRDASHWKLPGEAAPNYENIIHPFDKATGSIRPMVVVPAVAVPEEDSAPTLPDGDEMPRVVPYPPVPDDASGTVPAEPAPDEAEPSAT